MKSISQYKRAFYSVLCASFLVATPVFAATLKVGETFTLSSSEATTGNLYVAGGTVILSGPVSGDVLFAAGDSTISGTVSEDMFLVAGSAEVLGEVRGDVRALGGKVVLTEAIGGDAVVAGGVVSLISGSTIAGDAMIAGGKVSLLGDVEGNVYLAGADVFIDGKVVGNVTVYSSEKVRIGPNTVIGGSFSYKSPEEALIDPQAEIKGETSFSYLAPMLTAPDVRGFFASLVGAALAVRLIALIAAALFFVLSFRRMTGEFSKISLEHFWRSLLAGFIILIVVPFATLIVMLTVFGGLIAIALFLAWISLLLLAQIYAGVVFGNIVFTKLLKKELPPVIGWKTALLGTFALGIIWLVPYIGPFVACAFFLVSLGALSELFYRRVILSR